MIRFSFAHGALSKVLTASAVFACTLSAIKPAAADTFNVQYFTVAAGTVPDFSISGAPGGTSNDYVLSTLGPDGLPVFNPNYSTVDGSVAAPGQLNPAGEILWWSKSPYMTAAGTGTLDVTAGGVNMYPANQNGSDSPNELTAILTGSFDLASLSAVTFNVGADDDAFVYVDGMLVESIGGIHGDNSAPTNTVDLGAGEHSIQIFYADQEQVGARLSFSDASEGIVVTPPSATPEPGSLALLGTGMLAVGGVVRRRFKR